MCFTASFNFVHISLSHHYIRGLRKFTINHHLNVHCLNCHRRKGQFPNLGVFFWLAFLSQFYCWSLIRGGWWRGLQLSILSMPCFLGIFALHYHGKFVKSRSTLIIQCWCNKNTLHCFWYFCCILREHSILRKHVGGGLKCLSLPMPMKLWGSDAKCLSILVAQLKNFFDFFFNCHNSNFGRKVESLACYKISGCFFIQLWKMMRKCNCWYIQ